MRTRIAITMMLTMCWSGAVLAQDLTRKAEPSAPLFQGLGLGALVTTSQSPSLVAIGGYNSLLFGVGLQLSYASRGLAATSGDTTANEGKQWLMNASLGLQYMIYNRRPVAIGPELDYATSLAPARPFSINSLSPGVAFWYAPFNAPVLLGAAWLATITHADGMGTHVDLATAALRVALGFP